MGQAIDSFPCVLFICNIGLANAWVPLGVKQLFESMPPYFQWDPQVQT